MLKHRTPDTYPSSIYKYKLEYDSTDVTRTYYRCKVPQSFTLLDVAYNYGFYVYGWVNPKDPPIVPLSFRVLMTGEECEKRYLNKSNYWRTVKDGYLVAHVFLEDRIYEKSYDA